MLGCGPVIAVATRQPPTEGRSVCCWLAVHVEQIANRAQAGSAHQERLFYRLTHADSAIGAAQQQDFDHRRVPVWRSFRSLARDQKAVVDGWPAACARHCSRAVDPAMAPGFFCRHIQKMIQLQHLLMTLVAAFMPRHAMSTVPYLHIGRVDLGLDRGSHRQWRRVEVGQHLDAARSG